MTPVAQTGHDKQSASTRLPAGGLVARMVLGSLMLWIGNPAIWLWLGSKLRLLVERDKIEKGHQLNEGSIYPHELLDIRGQLERA